MSRVLRRRYGHAKDPMGAFRTAARKIEKMIADVAAGGDINSSFDTLHVSNAINKLDDRTNKAEIRGDDVAREEAWATVSRLRKALADARDAGYEARKNARNVEIKTIGERERDRLANMSPSERATYNYQQELKLTRGGR